MNVAKKKILIITLAWRPIESGGEVAPRKVAEFLSSDYIFDVLAYRFSKDLPPVENTSYGTIYRVGGFGHSHFKKELFTLIAGLKAKKLHKENSYDAIWVVMAAYGAGAAYVFNYFNPEVPIILTLQEGDPFEHIYKRLGFLKPMWKSFMSKVAGVHAISKYLANFAKEVGVKCEPVVIPNGVDVDRFSRPRSSTLPHIPLEGTVILVSHSRLVEKNAHNVVIKALQYLPERVIYTIVGGGPLENEMKELARSLGLEKRVAFVGQLPIEKTPYYLHQAHIFVRPSRSEGLGSSFLEAMAAGLPIIGTPVGGIPDFLEDGKTGLFCEVDNPQSLADAVARLINDIGLYGTLSRNGENLVKQNYSWEVVAERMQKELFSRIVKDRA